MSQKQQPYSEEVVEDPAANLMKLIGEMSPSVGASLAAFFGGAGLLLDDAHDFAKFDTPDHPNPLHHWLWGVLLMLGGVAGLGVSILNLLASNPEAARQLRERIEEARYAKKALPPDVLEKLMRE